MKLIEAASVAWKLALEHPANVFVFRFVIYPAVPKQKALRVRVHREHRVLARVEQNGIGRFRTNAENFEQLFAQNNRGSFEHALQRSRVLPAKKFAEGFE